MMKLNEKIDKEYLQRDLLENVSYDISENYIKVQSESTMFINLSKYELVNNKQELLNKRAEVIKLAKEKKVSLSYQRKTKKTINELWESYETDKKTSEGLYNEIKTGWINVKEERGIHMGFSDDQYISHLSKLISEYNSLSNTNKPTYILSELSNRLDETIRDLKYQKEDDNYRISKIHL